MSLIAILVTAAVLTGIVFVAIAFDAWDFVEEGAMRVGEKIDRFHTKLDSGVLPVKEVGVIFGVVLALVVLFNLITGA